MVMSTVSRAWSMADEIARYREGVLVAHYVIRRLAVSLAVLFIIVALNFVFIALAPGDPLQAMLAGEGAGNTANLERMRAEAGLDDPIPVQFVRWLAELLQGNLGTSFQTGSSTTDLIADAVPATLRLTVVSMVLAVLIGLPLGVVSALKERSALDTALTFYSYVFTSIPSFFLALVAVFTFAVQFSWFPANGMQSYDAKSSFGDALHHLALPVLVLTLLSIPTYVRYVRAAVLDVLRQDYIQTARAKGLANQRIVWVHMLSNALSPVITIAGLQLPFLLGSSLLVEQVFAWPGLGTLSIRSALFRDYPVFMATSLVYAAAVLVSSLITDLAYAAVDPRIRYS